MSLAPESLANRRVWPAKEMVREITAGSGRQCSMWLELSSPLGRFSKILLASLHWTNSEEYCYVWERLDTKFELSAFRLTQLEPNICDTESSLLPTPRKEGYDSQGKGHGDLQYEVKARLFPTPTVPNGGRRNPEGTSITGRKPDGSKAQIDLREFAIRVWPTPTAQNNGPNGQKSSLAAVLGSGSLNPRFVEELMGFPIDHTALKR